MNKEQGSPSVLITRLWPLTHGDIGALVIIVMVALAARWVWASLADQIDPFLVRDTLYGDASGYDLLARNLMDGRGLSWDGITPTAYRMPGYPIFLSTVYLVFGRVFVVVRWVQAVGGAIVCIPVFAISRSLLGGWRAAVATLGVAVYPVFVYITGWLYTETLFITIVWWGMLLIGLALTTGSRRYSISAGFAFGLATLFRPEIAGFIGFILLLGILLRWSRVRIKVLVVAQLVALAIILPWTMRNATQLGDWVFLTTNGGSNFYAGNNPNADGRDVWVPPLKGMSEVESDRIMMKRAIEWISSDPMAALALLPRKLGLFLLPLEGGTANTSFRRLAECMGIAYRVLILVSLVGFMRLRSNLYVALLAALVLWYLVVSLAIFGGSRLALPVVPAFIILSCGVHIGLPKVLSGCIKSGEPAL